MCIRDRVNTYPLLLLSRSVKSKIKNSIPSLQLSPEIQVEMTHSNCLAISSVLKRAANCSHTGSELSSGKFIPNQHQLLALVDSGCRLNAAVIRWFKTTLWTWKSIIKFRFNLIDDPTSRAVAEPGWSGHCPRWLTCLPWLARKKGWGGGNNKIFL